MNITFKIVSSGKTIVLIYSKSSSLVRISFMGLDSDFFAIAQIPTITCLLDASPSSSVSPRGSWKNQDVISKYDYLRTILVSVKAYWRWKYMWKKRLTVNIARSIINQQTTLIISPECTIMGQYWIHRTSQLLWCSTGVKFATLAPVTAN